MAGSAEKAYNLLSYQWFIGNLIFNPGRASMSQRYNSCFRAALLLLLALISTNACSFTFDWKGWLPGDLYHQYTNVGGSSVDVTMNVSGFTRSFQGSAPLLDSDKLELRVNYSHRNEYVDVIFNFSEPITISNLGIWNIDSNNYQDAVQVTAIGSGGGFLAPSHDTHSHTEYFSLPCSVWECSV